jgi:8-oxo-dGTP pyrophosphatase MutT (NUDIX family)
MNEDFKVLENGVTIATYAKTMIVNEKNEVLVLTISNYEAHPEKSFTPDLPGGHIQVGIGESEKDGAIREAKEETGISLHPQDVYLVYTSTTFYEHENRSVIGQLYAVRLDHTPEVTISWEHAEYEWVPLSELLLKKEFRSFHETAIHYVLDHELI